MSGWVERLAALIVDGTPAVLVSLAEAAGSTPRTAGTRMVVTADAIHGTIGGGKLEHRAIKDARELLCGPSAIKLDPVALGPQLGQCCGGSVALHFETIDAPRDGLDVLQASLAADAPAVLVTDIQSETSRRLAVASDAAAGEPALGSSETISHARKVLLGAATAGEHNALRFEIEEPPALQIALFGAGHVGRALAAVLATMPCRLRWIDERAGEFPDVLPAGVVQIVPEEPADIIDDLPSGAHILIMTHSHKIDLDLVEGALRRGDFASLGLIGSATKRAQFEKRLRALGFTDAQLARLTCPIGIDGITGKEPGAIAVAAAAQILQRHEAAQIQPAEEASA